MIIGIIGAGASGMMAALSAAENPNAQVVLFERQARVGRKLQATGNGRCNLTNMYAGKTGYHGQQPGFSKAALEKMSPEATRRWFMNLGLLTTVEPSGKVYPYSNQANSVVDVLRLALQKPNITLYTGFEVQKVVREGTGFLIAGNEQTVVCDKIIIACGGLAGSKLGGSMYGYKLLSKFGHKATKLRPSLVQIQCGWGGVAALKGVRAQCHVQIMKDDTLFAQSTGELHFTDYGLSGPVIFEVSRDVCYGGGNWIARLDVLPAFSKEQLLEQLQLRRCRNVLAEDLLTGMIHNQLGRVLTKSAGITVGTETGKLSDTQLAEVVRVVKEFEIPLTEPMGMDNAQVTAGGVLTQDFCPETMESKLIPGLYACGEVLDVDGDCGGYNLQWAWSSGYLAGLHAGKETL